MRRKNTQTTTYILIVSLLLIGVVYALLQANLEINGLAKILHNTWDVHFDNIQISSGSVPIGSGDSPATIDPENNCKVDFEVTLSLPGDYYEFTVDVVNSGTIDGMIGELNKALIINNEEVQEVPDYLNYSITYDDGIEIENNHKVSAGTVETYLVRLEFKTDIEELPQAATIVTTLEPQYIQADSSAIEVYHPTRLYNVFASEYNSNSGLVQEYTGEHKDSFTENGTQKIYHWYIPKNTNGNIIKNKNNVIFANHCWQMIRTTDTGGVKLIYNGEVENNQCLDTRGNHVGYHSYSAERFDGNYWYGSDYIYDKNSNTFQLSGTLEQSTWSEQNAVNLIGKYSCKSTNANDTCSTLYLIESFFNYRVAETIPIKSDSNFYQFGVLQINLDDYSPAFVGYMYGDVYSYNQKNMIVNESFSNEEPLFLLYRSFSPNYLYSKTINNTGSGYELDNPILGSDIPEDNYVGYYTFNSSSTTSGTTPYYIVGFSNGSTYYYVQVSSTKPLSDYNLMVGDSLIDNLDGTYSLDSTTLVNPSKWYSNANNYNNKYTCGDTTTTCSNPVYIVLIIIM